MAHGDNLPMKIVSGWTCFVTEAKLVAPLRQLGHHRRNRSRLGGDVAKKSDFAVRVPSAIATELFHFKVIESIKSLL